MKIVLLGESPHYPSGFGQQIRLLAEGLRDAGHSIVLITPPPPAPAAIRGVEELELETVDSSVLDQRLEEIGPDRVICFWHADMVKQFARLSADYPTFFWLPWEGSTLPDFSGAFGRIGPDRVVHLSQFARRLWLRDTNSRVIIPLGIDFDTFRPQDRDELRRKWAPRLGLRDDSFVVLNVDRNIWHKRWDATFDFVRRLERMIKSPVQLIAHTKRVEKKTGDASGFDLDELECVYRIKGRVVYTGFDWNNALSQQELAELYHICDFRISTSMGEGFGLPTAEVAACGVPQIVNNTTTMPEVLSPSSEALIAPAMSEFRNGVLYQVPDVAAMVERARLMSVQRIDTDSDRVHVLSRFSKQSMIEKWCELLERK